MSNENMNQGVPTFTPPQDTVPTFTPPTAPKFTPPPAPTFSGPACHYHSDEPAVRRCARCGKYICQDCVDNYQVTNDEYEGKPLCYDCCQELVSENISTLTANLNKIKLQFGLSIVGIVIGFIIGLSAGISGGDFGAGLLAGLIYGCVGGVFLSAMKAFFSLMWDAIKIAFAGQFGWLTIISIIVQIFVIMIKCVFVTISNTIQYIIYIKKTNGFIESDTRFLQQIKDYMEYTLVRNKYAGVRTPQEHISDIPHKRVLLLYPMIKTAICTKRVCSKKNMLLRKNIRTRCAVNLDMPDQPKSEKAYLIRWFELFA